ncbi:2-hydroxyacid dehydrogenase [Pseudorhizobium pelagicum]|uniref:2-hydroxyacid dehydrogenase n=2 Tax=Pseudorhizobium pelagicum TaxID=1509405 RepID=A0A922NYM7_9HYPH|nr:2-hydroxyacid dehydrogenase [Pseudorhizobium pelagicum]KEQ08246.1 2-hydroxyacid dehydrogenase [Pseudorhizobium pelagicum]
MRALIEELGEICGSAQVLTKPSEMETYATDWKRSVKGNPVCVVRPASTQEVALVVRACRRYQVAIVPQGGNTGLAAGATPSPKGGDVVVSLVRLNQIRSIDPLAMTVEVEAGAILQTVKEKVETYGRLLPVGIAAEGSATIGGIVSTNAGGISVLRYGMTRALVLGLEVVLADGTIVDGLRHLRKDNSGYDWKQLFIGAEGTLGIVTAAVLRLVPRPRGSVTAFLSVPDVDAAARLFSLSQELVGDALSTFELISQTSVALVEKHVGLRSPIAAGGWYLLVEAASSLSGLEQAMETMLGKALEDGLAVDGVVAASGQQVQSIWSLREHITEAEARHGESLKHDISIPIGRMSDFLVEAGEAVTAICPQADFNIFGHLGDGNLHYNVLLNGGQEHEAVNRAVHDVVVLYRGSISAEHGIGQYRLKEWLRTKPETEQKLARAIKQVLDRDCMMNPGKLLPLNPG